MESSQLDSRYMALALRLAERGRCSTKPNPRVGCVLVRDGEIVGRGFHHHAGGPHAERVALADAGEKARGATAYVTLEPCCHYGRTPPCTEGLIEAGVRRVVYADGDTNPQVAGAGVRQLEAAGIRVTGGVMADEARKLNRGFHSRHQRGRPFITLKLGMSLDGKLALANGQSQWITSAEARADVQRLRAQSCAVLCGIGTVLADNPRMTVRDPRFDLADRQPARIVLDGRLRFPASAAMLREPGRTVVFTRNSDDAAQQALRTVGAEIESQPAGNEALDLMAVCARLAALEFNEVLVESGPVLAGALLDAGLIDELVIYLAPMLLGATARSAFASRELRDLSDATRFHCLETRSIGPDLRLTLAPALA